MSRDLKVCADLKVGEDEPRHPRPRARDGEKTHHRDRERLVARASGDGVSERKVEQVEAGAISSSRFRHEGFSHVDFFCVGSQQLGDEDVQGSGNWRKNVDENRVEVRATRRVSGIGVAPRNVAEYCGIATGFIRTTVTSWD